MPQRVTLKSGPWLFGSEVMWDRFDICEAHCVLEWDYNLGGWLHERPSNRRRSESTGVQLGRAGFSPSPCLGYSSLSENGRLIYLLNVIKLRLPCDEEQITRMNEAGLEIAINVL